MVLVSEFLVKHGSIGCVPSRSEEKWSLHPNTYLSNLSGAAKCCLASQALFGDDGVKGKVQGASL